MCGIVAVYKADGPVNLSVVQRALTAIGHRGPDGTGVWMDPHGEVIVGHALLATVARSNVHQPIGDSRGNHVAVNGEFYDFEEIRRSLIDDGYVFHTGSDSEIALPLFSRYGADFFRYLRGEFAFLLWDATRRRLIAARDRFGIKPLYYAEHAGTVYLASEIKALFAMGLPSAWDQEAVATYHSSHLPVGRTFFSGVFSVPPGHYLDLHKSSNAVRRYWSWPLASTLPPADAVESVRDALVNAVQVRTRAEGGIGVFLSGGVDSTAIAAIMRHISETPATALTVVFPASDRDESEIACSSAEYLGGMKLVKVHATTQALTDTFEMAVLAAEAPALNCHGAAKCLLARAAKDNGLRVVLTGEGADEVFWGYPQLITSWKREVPAWLDDSGGFSAVWQGLYSDELCQQMRRRDLPAEVVSSVERHEIGPTDSIARAAWLWSRIVLPAYQFRHLGDGVEMVHGVEGRLPFLDHHLAEIAIPLDRKWKLRGGLDKYILRKAVEPLVPPHSVNRRKQAFFGPAAVGPLRVRLVENCIETASTLPFLDRRKTTGLVHQLATAPSDWDEFLFELASFCILQRAFNCATE